MVRMTVAKRLFWPAVGVCVLLWAFGVVDGAYIVAPLMGLAIYRVGIGSLASLRAGGAHIPDGPPAPVDTRRERTVYWCGGCGSEVLLLVKGADVPPRHCGERMTARSEVAHDLS
jgi:DNA-directed RNA polymerase subunit RPC12/RpoP